jgi:hypoxia up-regulated 1
MRLVGFYFLSLILGAIIGIDFGQQYTKAVLLAPNINFEIILTDTGKRKDLSAFAVRSLGNSHQGKGKGKGQDDVSDDDIERVYGSDAVGICSRFPHSCINDIKSLLGKSIDNLDSFYDSHFGLSIKNSSRNTLKLDLGLKNYDFYPEEIMAMNFLQIRNRAQLFLQNHQALPILDDVAITIPPFASIETKQAYLDSLKLANFTNILGLIDEGTAVALNFIMNQKLVDQEVDSKLYYLIYDMGAGTTTATLFSFLPNSSILEIESIGFDGNLGGKTLTKSIFDIFVNQFISQFNSDPSDKIKSKLYEFAEKAKIILSANTNYKTTLESLYNDEDFKISISRDEFEQLNSHVVEKLNTPILSALDQVGITIDNITSVILNGGSTRVPFIQKNLNDFIGNKDKISKSVNTDESCALGTTYRALQLKSTFGEPSGIEVIEKSNFNYNLKLNGHLLSEPIFKIGSISNNSTQLSLGFVNKTNDSIKLELLENDRAYKSYEISDLIKKAEKLNCKSKQSRQIIATFHLDINKMFDLDKIEIQCFSENIDIDEVENNDEIIENGNSTNETVSFSKIKKPSSINVPIPKPNYLTVKPIVRSIHDVLKQKLVRLDIKDKQRLELNNLKNSLEALCYEIRNFIEDNLESLLESTTQDDLDELSQTVRDTIDWLEFDSDDSDMDEIKAKFEKLSKKKSELDSYSEMEGKDLSIDGMKQYHTDGKIMVEKINERIAEFENEIADFKPKFESEDFDFSKELERIEIYLKNKNNGIESLEEVKNILQKFESSIKDSEKFVKSNTKKWAKLMKKDIYHYYKNMSNSIVDLLTEIMSMEQDHKEKIEMLGNKLKQLVKRKTQKEARLKQKQKQAEEEAANEKVDPVEELIIEPNVEESPDYEFFESVKSQETSSTTKVEHDEL